MNRQTCYLYPCEIYCYSKSQGWIVQSPIFFLHDSTPDKRVPFQSLFSVRTNCSFLVFSRDFSNCSIYIKVFLEKFLPKDTNFQRFLSLSLPIWLFRDLTLSQAISRITQWATWSQADIKFVTILDLKKYK